MPRKRINIQVNAAELALLDEKRGAMTRSEFVNHLVASYDSALDDDERVASPDEVLELLSAQARAGRVNAQIALWRALKERGDGDDQPQPEADEFDAMAEQRLRLVGG